MKKPNKFSNHQVLTWLQQHHQLSGDLVELVGDEDKNFKFQAANRTYTVKISQVENTAFLGFEQALIHHLSFFNSDEELPLQLPQLKFDQNNQWLSALPTANDDSVFMRLLTWVDGQLWSDYLPHDNQLLNHLGQQAAKLDQHLASFKHTQSHRKLSWDLAQALWVKDHLHTFSKEQKNLLAYFIDQFEGQQATYHKLRKQVIHNDLNDNNILISDARISGFIDFGDAVNTQLINELAIICAYGLMHKPDPLRATKQIIAGYHHINPLTATELAHLYVLIGMRLVVSLTHAALAREQSPDNQYKSISEQPAWDGLHKWCAIPAQLAHFTFRKACGLTTHPQQDLFTRHIEQQSIKLTHMFPAHAEKQGIQVIDLGVASTLVGMAADYESHDQQLLKMHRLQQQYPDHFLAGGYLEARSFYASDAFSYEGNSGKEYRTMHLGLDVWLAAGTVICAPLAGKIVGYKDNNNTRDYGPTVILEHCYSGGVFYTLYGHLSRRTLTLHQLGDWVEVGEQLAWVGDSTENGGWSPHLHFQIMHDLLGHQHDFPGACRPIEVPVMAALCPNPLSLFKDVTAGEFVPVNNEELIKFRQNHLGSSMSLSYNEPLQMLRGDDVYLIDQWGQKYLDTCNNVAHVGHENPQVVRAGQNQMGLLNTNTRYLHPMMMQFTQQLLETLPEQLSVVHMVNSGSEANELALRMAKAYSGGNDIIAIEAGYHGNSNACVDVSSYKFDGKGGHGAPKHTHIVPLPDKFRGLHRGENTADAYAQYVNKILEKLGSKGRQVAAFIGESIISCGGQIIPPEGYFKQVYQAVREAGGVCIADEVQTGCGRTGNHFWAFEAHDVVPDIVTIGKPIGNGHPLAVVVCTPAVAARFANGMEYFNTFGGNPVSAAIGLAVLLEIKTKRLQQNAWHIGTYLIQQLEQLRQQHPIIKDIRGLGLFLGFELCDRTLGPLPEQADYLANRMRELGILISTDGPDHNVIKIKPPMTFNQSHADELILRLSTVFKEAQMQI